MKKRFAMLLTAAMLTQAAVPAIPSMTTAVFAEESASAQIFRILTEDGGFNSAAACGILGNIQQESSLNPNAQSAFYGLVQLDSGRLAGLRSYCAENGYDYTTIEGQMHYVLYELSTSFTGVRDTLMSVPDTAEGAYTAMQVFCHDYEQCGNYDWEYSTRGGYTSSFWSQYGGTVSSSDDEDEEYSEEETEDYSEENSEDYSDDSYEDESYEEESYDDEDYEDESYEEESYEDTSDSDDAEDNEDSEDSSYEVSSAYSDSDFRYLLSLDYDVDLIFDYDYYVSRYPEVVDEVGSGYDAVLRHFLTYGTAHGRRGSLNFSVLNYQENNSDLVERYGDEYVKYYVQYVKSGYYEGRSGSVSSEQHEKEQAAEEEEAEWQAYLESIGMTEEEWVEQNC